MPGCMTKDLLAMVLYTEVFGPHHISQYHHINHSTIRKQTRLIVIDSVNNLLRIFFTLSAYAIFRVIATHYCFYLCDIINSTEVLIVR